MKGRESELEEAQDNIRRLEEQLRQLREAKEELEGQQDQLKSLMTQVSRWLLYTDLPSCLAAGGGQEPGARGEDPEGGGDQGQAGGDRGNQVLWGPHCGAEIYSHPSLNSVEASGSLCRQCHTPPASGTWWRRGSRRPGPCRRRWTSPSRSWRLPSVCRAACPSPPGDGPVPGGLDGPGRAAADRRLLLLGLLHLRGAGGHHGHPRHHCGPRGGQGGEAAQSAARCDESVL